MTDKKKPTQAERPSNMPNVRKPPAMEGYRAKQKELKRLEQELHKKENTLESHKPSDFKSGKFIARVLEDGKVDLFWNTTDQPTPTIPSVAVEPFNRWLDATFIGLRAEADEEIAGLRRLLKEEKIRVAELTDRLTATQADNKHHMMELAEIKEAMGVNYPPSRDDDPVHPMLNTEGLEKVARQTAMEKDRR